MWHHQKYTFHCSTFFWKQLFLWCHNYVSSAKCHVNFWGKFYTFSVTLSTWMILQSKIIRNKRNLLKLYIVNCRRVFRTWCTCTIFSWQHILLLLAYVERLKTWLNFRQQYEVSAPQPPGCFINGHSLTVYTVTLSVCTQSGSSRKPQSAQLPWPVQYCLQASHSVDFFQDTPKIHQHSGCLSGHFSVSSGSKYDVSVQKWSVETYKIYISLNISFTVDNDISKAHKVRVTIRSGIQLVLVFPEWQ